MPGNLHDTICAIATAVGEGGIGIVRISGEKAIEVASSIVRLRSGRPLASVKNHRVHHADVLEAAAPGRTDARRTGSQRLDEALVLVMRAPHSYTAEDVVEIQCHGGPFVLQAICEAAIRGGARLAEPGEFTKRAFLNGRLDLTQAEAVLDTIRAKTSGSLRLAQEQLRGTLSKEIDGLRDALVGLLAHVEAAIDFTEEDITFLPPQALLSGLTSAITAVTRLVETCEEGRILREGIMAAIIGRPNVGKSSLLNALLETDRAIVTPVPGTTRDVLEEVLNIRGIPVRLVDTAGVRDTNDPVEREGVRRSRAAMNDAELLLLVLDGSVPLTTEDRELLGQHADKKRLVVVNKTDLPFRIDSEELERLSAREPGQPPTRTVWLSVRTGAGLDGFRDALRTMMVRADFEPGEAAVVTRLRHRTNLTKTREALAAAIQSVEARLSGEFVAMDLRAAIDALGEITGAVTTDDILDRIFREFCIGK
jgi:tRNA modification GTPase